MSCTSVLSPSFVKQNSKSSFEDSANVHKARSRNENRVYSFFAFPNIPSGLNLLYLIPGTVRLITVLCRSLREGDREESADVCVRLLGLPASVFSSFGTITQGLQYLIQWHIIAPIAVLLPLAPVVFCCGIFLCFVEIVVATVNWLRIQRFCYQFNFNLFTQLKILLVDFDSDTSFDFVEVSRAVKNISELLDRDSEKFMKIFGKGGYQKIMFAFDGIDCKAALKKKKEKIEQAAISLMLNDLIELRDRYVSLTEDEKGVISERIDKKFNSLIIPDNKLKQKLQEAFHEARVVKNKRLIRRVRACMLELIRDEIDSLIEAFEKGDNSPLAEGLEIFENMRIQTVKVKIILAIDIMILTLTICVFALALAGCPVLPVSVLVGISLTACVARFVIYRTILDTLGWRWDIRRLLPACVSKCIFPQTFHAAV